MWRGVNHVWLGWGVACQQAGVTPVVLRTWAHRAHAGGLVNAAGRAVFDWCLHVKKPLVRRLLPKVNVWLAPVWWFVLQVQISYRRALCVALPD